MVGYLQECYNNGTRQFKEQYMESDKFNPQEEVAFKQIKQVLHNVNRTKEVKKSIYE